MVLTAIGGLTTNLKDAAGEPVLMKDLAVSSTSRSADPQGCGAAGILHA